MARTAITPVVAPGGYITAGTVLPLVACDAVNGNLTKLTGKELLFFQNTDGAAVHHVTITSVNDALGRSGTITLDTIPISGYQMYGPFALLGWQQTDGNLYFTADSALIFVAVIRLP